MLAVATDSNVLDLKSVKFILDRPQAEQLREISRRTGRLRSHIVAAALDAYLTRLCPASSDASSPTGSVGR